MGFQFWLRRIVFQSQVTNSYERNLGLSVLQKPCSCWGIQFECDVRVFILILNVFIMNDLCKTLLMSNPCLQKWYETVLQRKWKNLTLGSTSTIHQDSRQQYGHWLGIIIAHWFLKWRPPCFLESASLSSQKWTLGNLRGKGDTYSGRKRW